LRDDLYALLGIDKNASKEEIKKAFRKRARETHPDSDTPDEEAFRKVKQASTVLLDPKKREQYDTTGDVGDDSEEAEIERMAMNHIVAMFENFISLDNPEAADLMDTMSRKLKSESQKFSDQIVALEAKQAKLEKLVSRFTKKKKSGNNLFQALMGTKIKQIGEHIKASQMLHLSLERAHKIVADYDYKFDVPPPPDQTMWTTTQRATYWHSPGEDDVLRAIAGIMKQATSNT
jgi:DnaJ-class molecular chaperone